MTALAAAVPGTVRLQSAPRLFNRNFVLLWQAQLVSQFGNQAFTIALMFWTAEATRSATTSGLMVLAGVIPVIALAPFTGTFADRQRSRLRIVIGCDLTSGVLSTLLALGFIFAPGAWRTAMLFAAALLIGVCNAFFDPAVNALAPDLVPRAQIEAANAFRLSSRQMTTLAAQALGGILYALVGPAALFLLNGLSFLFAGASEALIRPGSSDIVPPRPRADGGRAFVAETAEGFRYVAGQPGMIGLLVATSIFNALLTPVSILLPVYATGYLHTDVRWYGLLLASISAGAVAGYTIIGATCSKLTGSSRRLLLIGGYAMFAVALAVLGQIRSHAIALAVLFVTGLLTGVINVLVISTIQRRTPDAFRGRVLGLHTMMIRVLMPIGLVGGGVVADLTGRKVPVVYAVCGALALATATLLASRRTTRAFLASS
jgi:DHA3 family macrolide efflux protein-like MFS transporter